MKYFKDEIFELLNMGGGSGYAEYDDAYNEYKKEFNKIRKKLPKAFLEAYETIGFHDAIIPKVSISTAYQGFNRDEHGNRTSLELVILKYNSEMEDWHGWVIVLENIRDLTIAAESEGKSLTCIDRFHHDELLPLMEGYLSWEINAIDADFKVEFKTLKIRTLNKLELNQYENTIKPPYNK